MDKQPIALKEPWKKPRRKYYTQAELEYLEKKAFREKVGRPQVTSARIEEVFQLPGVVRNYARIIWAVLFFFIIVFLLFGGLASISAIFKITPWWIWIGGILILVLYWRYRK